jgi:serine/threonine protein kinase
MPISPGSKLGRYEVLELIGRGAMGAVFKAYDPQIDREVAIKTISVVNAEDEGQRDYRQRFVQEARAAGRLFHPAIVTILDVGEDPESHDPYIVMELVAGEALDKRIQSCPGKRLPLDLSLRITAQVAEALGYAHQQGVIHRDVKLANILITEDGQPKIADFGVAKLNQSSLTLAGEMMGSPAYMAPEQLAGEAVDSRADLFSLGVVFYTLITGHRPFQGNSTATVVFKVVNRAPLPVTAFDASLPPSLDELIAKAIAKDPAERFQSGGEMATAIRRLHESLAQPEEPSPGLQADSLTELLDRQSFPKKLLVRNPPLPVLTPTTRPPRKVSKPRRYIWPAAAGLAGVALASLAFFWWPQPKEIPVKNAPIPIASAAAPEATSQEPEIEAELEVKHNLVSGQLQLWVDDRLALARKISGETKRRGLLFQRTEGIQLFSFKAEPGAHRIRVRVKSDTPAYEQNAKLTCKVGAGTRLKLVCDKHALRLSKG